MAIGPGKLRRSLLDASFSRALRLRIEQRAGWRAALCSADDGRLAVDEGGLLADVEEFAAERFAEHRKVAPLSSRGRLRVRGLSRGSG